MTSHSEVLGIKTWTYLSGRHNSAQHTAGQNPESLWSAAEQTSSCPHSGARLPPHPTPPTHTDAHTHRYIHPGNIPAQSHTQTHRHRLLDRHTQIHTHINARIQIHTPRHTHVHTHTDTRTDTHTHIRRHTQTHRCTHIHIQRCTHRNTYTDTHR